MIQPAFRFGCFFLSQRQTAHHRWCWTAENARLEEPCRKYSAQPRVICPSCRNVTPAVRLVVCRLVAALTLARIPFRDFFAG